MEGNRMDNTDNPELQNQNECGKTRVKKIPIAVALVCLIAIAGAVGMMIFTGKDGTYSPSTPVAPVFESGAEEWQGARTTATSGASDGIRLPGYKSITVAANKKDVSVNLYNPKENKCYFVIRLVLIDTSETLYESKLIEPGKGLYSITLSKALKAGTYKAQLQYEPYDMNTLTRLNGAVMNLDLIAK